MDDGFLFFVTARLNRNKPARISRFSRAGLVLVFSFLVVHLASAQTEFRFNGYFVTFPVYENLNSTVATFFGVDQKQFVEISRLRLRPSLAVWDGGYFMLEYEANAAYSTGSFFTSAMPQTTNGQVVDLAWTPVQSPRWNVTHFIDRLYYQHTTDVVDVTVGRQRISWGTGRVWNPTDLFNPINPTSFSKIEKDGVDAFLAKIILGNFTDLSLVFDANREFRNNNYGFRFRSNVEGYDFSFMGGVFDERLVVGGDFAGSILDAGVRGEGIYSTSRDKPQTNFVSFILGIDNQFDEKLYGLVEYHFNGRGKSILSQYELQRLLAGEILNLGRHYVTVQASYLIHPLVAAQLGTTRSLTDESGFVALNVLYSSSNETSLSLGGQYFYGSDFSEYWYYPHTLYLKFDCYF